ncbi:MULTISPECIES: CoxG family protein [Roseinatronobacter]|uniref:Carbon monoxide dehydrogenase subunit G n=1 Tax=Roseinatronobacter domitianus TaxID=2940293 RepID=A0ABT0M0F9_9RHOB|nr:MULTISPECIES: carbon monoxide dehydrogenase subunit G [Roseibaca]MCL1627880.1 carbon monoxide dehydrogenase subunit G [Roseibaca domitiana]
MELSGTRIIAADRATVWAHLNDPETLRAAIPGCKSLEGSPDEGFVASVTQKIGPVKATFKGKVTLTDINAPESYRIVGEGNGGIAGFAKGDAVVTLREVPEGTELTYEATAALGGKLAQLGSRLVGGVAKRLAGQFFDAFQAHIENGPDDATEGA